jgi:flavin reductase (DIM6/NTAB) family NADH-FMN oxidoreductase RutF
MIERTYLQNAEEMMKKITKGAFLTVRAEDQVNTMTIGWATIGFVWKKEVFMVAVRDSRHTFSLMEKSDNFTVTVPTDKTFKEAVMFCGTKSGRDFDKFKECGLTQEQVSDHLGLARPTVGQIEGGRRSVSSLELDRFAHLGRRAD